VIIDCHCHAGQGSGADAFWNAEARLERHLARARDAGIDRTVVFPTFSPDYDTANARLAHVVRRHERDVIGFAGINPTRDAGHVASLLGRAVEEYGFRGLKVHGHESLPTREVCDAARRYRLPMLVDVVRRVEVVDALAERYPEIDFIIPHLGGFSDDWVTQTRLIDRLCRLPNVYADTSGVRYWEMLVRSVRLAGPAKILFGSDGPFLHPGLELYKIKLLRLPAASEALIIGGNIARLLGLSRSVDRICAHTMSDRSEARP
jgi:predicted TIM-barrel fold metal-dependent hydrolase